MSETYTDCRTEEGITVGLIDAMITLCRLLAKRDMSSKGVAEALKDLSSDEDFLGVLEIANSTKDER